MPLSGSIAVFSSSFELSLAAAHRLHSMATKAISSRGVFTVAFSGGSLPSVVSSSLVPLLKDDPDLQHWRFIFADERFVPLTHDDSNFKLLKEQILEPIGIGNSQVLALEYSRGLDAATTEYSDKLEKLTDGVIDCVLLGMGPDGHTASLFPNHALLDSKGLVVSISDSPKPPSERITLTLPAINSSRNVIFIVTGSIKNPVLSQIDGPSKDIPASLISPTGGLYWFLDSAAAGDTIKPSE